MSRVVETWTDEQRADPFVEASHHRTEMVAWIWYPVTPTSEPTVGYLPDEWQRQSDLREQATIRLMPLRGRINSWIARDSSRVRTHSSVGGLVTPNASPFPIVILRAGLGAGTVQYTTLAEDLASHGYVVVGFDAPYRTATVVFPDGRVTIRPPELNPDRLAGGSAERLRSSLLTA